MDDFDTELKIGFLDEAAQLVTDVEQCFLGLESNPNDIENLNKIFRLAHNLKGSSKAVGFDAFGEFTHEFESFILKVKNGDLTATSKVINLLLRSNDHVAQMIDGLKKDLSATFDSSVLLKEMSSFSEPAPEAGAETASSISADVTESSFAEPLAEEAQVEIVRSSQSELAASPIATVSAPMAPGKVQEGHALAPVSKSTNPPQHDESLRVSLAKVESLINFVGEMAILQSVLREQTQSYDSPLLRKTVQQIGKVSKEIQEVSMGLRMVPVKPTFQKMQRIVRDTAQALGKEVAINLIGEETELDKTVLEKINDPLVHLIRNSVDHGIESADIRLASGKEARGQVKLCAYHRAGKLILQVSDDGAGLNPEKLKKKAIEKGIVKPDNQLSDKEALNLIFAPGFSTKEKVTDVSGRGVGMDVVKTNIQDLGGEVLIDSKIGFGTTFKIILPLTLAIIDAMVLRYSDEKYVIPLNHVFETLRPNSSSINSGPLGELLLLRAETLPLYRLGDFFGIRSTSLQSDMIAIVIRSGPEPFAILVDDILGQFQIVTKMLGAELQGIKGISGSTILGDGKPALILEPQELLTRKISNNFVQKNANQPKEARGAA